MKFEIKRPKSRFGVGIELKDAPAGAILTGNVFLDQGDIFEDVIDADTPFLVFEDGQGAVQLIQRDLIRRVVSLKDERIGLLVADRHEERVIMVMGGEERSGVLMLTTYSRVSDHMNKGGMFTAFRPDGGRLEFVNKSAIERVILEPR
ncbi:MAG: hypothetical protein GC201_13040 [Alphaproteobacteria bacterium]|nr:hypothetical protein [Alphaproteobacteria bacterium]